MITGDEYERLPYWRKKAVGNGLQRGGANFMGLQWGREAPIMPLFFRMPKTGVDEKYAADPAGLHIGDTEIVGLQRG